MRICLVVFILNLLYFNIEAKAPQAIKYQGVARDNNGEAIVEKDISLKISIIEDSVNGFPIYTEKHNTKTNQFGLFNLNIGQGKVIDGIFNYIEWGLTEHFTKIEMDINGGEDYQLIGTSQLLSVPYSLHAENSDSSFYSIKSYSETSGTASYSKIAETVINYQKVESFDTHYPDGIDSIQYIFVNLNKAGQSFQIPEGVNFHGNILVSQNTVNNDWEVDRFDINNYSVSDHRVKHLMPGTVIKANHLVPGGKGIRINGYLSKKIVEIVFTTLPYIVPKGKTFYGTILTSSNINKPNYLVQIPFYIDKEYFVNDFTYYATVLNDQFYLTENTKIEADTQYANDNKLTYYINGFLIDKK